MGWCASLILREALNSTKLIDNKVQGVILLLAAKGSVCALWGRNGLFGSKQIGICLDIVRQINRIEKVRRFVAHLQH